MQITEDYITQLAAEHGGRVEKPSERFPNIHIYLPNHATVSIGYGGGHYCSARSGIGGAFVGSLPQEEVEVAYWHPQIRPRVIDWASDEDDAYKPGDPGGMLPNNDVHGWTDAARLREIVETAAALTPDWDLAR